MTKKNRIQLLQDECEKFGLDIHIDQSPYSLIDVGKLIGESVTNDDVYLLNSSKYVDSMKHLFETSDLEECVSAGVITDKIKKEFLTYKGYIDEIKDRRAKKDKKASRVKKRFKNESGCLYLLKSNGIYKIGISKNPEKRIDKYKTENPFPVDTIYKSEMKKGYMQIESDIKKKYNHKVVAGKEWLKITKHEVDDIISIIKSSII